MMALLDLQFCMATAAAYVLNRWRSSGGVIASIPAAPYPDERYQTKMMWWNRRDFVNHAEPEQVAKILKETQQLTQEFHSRYETEALVFSVERDSASPTTPVEQVSGCPIGTRPDCERRAVGFSSASTERLLPERVEILRGDLPIPRLLILTNRQVANPPSPKKSIGTTRLANSDSIAALSSGRDSRKPCARWHPKSSSALAAVAVSTPSATTSSPRACAKATIARTIARSRVSVPRSRTNHLSILSMSTGRDFRYVNAL